MTDYPYPYFEFRIRKEHAALILATGCASKTNCLNFGKDLLNAVSSSIPIFIPQSNLIQFVHSSVPIAGTGAFPQKIDREEGKESKVEAYNAFKFCEGRVG